MKSAATDVDYTQSFVFKASGGTIVAELRDALRIFVVAARHPSFADAASELNLTQVAEAATTETFMLSIGESVPNP